MKLYLLDLGYMEMDGNLLVSGSTMATDDNRNKPLEWKPFPIPAWLIVTDSGKKILYDTGNNDDWKTVWVQAIRDRSPYYQTEEQTLLKQIEKCGFTKDDIDMVILSHMHLDHAGGLKHFVDKEIVVHRDEFATALVKCHMHYPNEQSEYVPEEINLPFTNLRLIEGQNDYLLEDGIELIMLPGHCTMVMGLKLTLKNTGTVILTADACYQQFNFEPPAKGSGFVADGARYFASIEKVREMAKREKATIFFGHDLEQQRAMKHAPEYYD